MVSFEPAALFQHPAVQYIPIGVEELWTGQSAAGPPALAVTQLVPGPDGTIQFGVTGARVTKCYYRAHQAILIARVLPGCGQAFRLACRYFYKPVVAFDMFGEDAQPLASVSARVLTG